MPKLHGACFYGCGRDFCVIVRLGGRFADGARLSRAPHHGSLADRRGICAKVSAGRGGHPRRRPRGASIRGPEGYTLTASSAVAVVASVLGGEALPGFQTPSLAYGPDFVLTLPGVCLTTNLTRKATAASRFDEVWVQLPDGQGMCALINGDWGWLMYICMEGDASFSSRKSNYDGPADAQIEYELSNGQHDLYPTVGAANGVCFAPSRISQARASAAAIRGVNSGCGDGAVIGGSAEQGATAE